MNFMNEGKVDRLIRIVLGIVFLFAAISTHGAWAVLFYILAVLALFTGILGFCLIYRLFGISTRQPKV